MEEQVVLFSCISSSKGMKFHYVSCCIILGVLFLFLDFVCGLVADEI